MCPFVFISSFNSFWPTLLAPLPLLSHFSWGDFPASCPSVEKALTDSSSAAPGQDDTFFHLNHPIRWVRVVGVVVAVDQYYGRRVYTIDDGSGACIECVTTVSTTKKPGEAAAVAAAAAEAEDPYADIDVGLVVEARGGLALYRQQKQIQVTRLRRVASTAAEVAFWHKIRAFAADVLAHPWVVDARQRRRLEKEARRDVVSGGGGAARRRHRSHHDDKGKDKDDEEEAKAVRKRRRNHEEKGAAPGDGGAGARKEEETRRRRKERHARDETTPNGILPRTGNSLLDEARRRRREKAEKLREASKPEPTPSKFNALGL